MGQDHGDFLPFAKPSISEEAINEVVECLRSGWITTGPRVAQFTADLSLTLAVLMFCRWPLPRLGCILPSWQWIWGPAMR